MNKKQILLILEKQSKELADLLAKLEKSHINKIEGLLVCRKKSGKPQFERQNPDLTETYLGAERICIKPYQSLRPSAMP